MTLPGKVRYLYKLTWIMTGVCIKLTTSQSLAVLVRYCPYTMSGIRNCLLIIVVLQAVVNRLSGQGGGKIVDELVGAGFENTRCIIKDEKCFVSIENHVYRWDIAAISRALDIISSDIDGSLEINLLILVNDIPRKLVRVNSTDWKNFSTGITVDGTVPDNIDITNKTGSIYDSLKKAEVSNRGAAKKFDLVVYPQIYFENTRINQFYETQVNIAPALEFSLWRGNRFTGQAIFPVQNSLGYEGDHIRPGFVTMAQEFRFSDNLSASVTAGNFAGSTYGISAYMIMYTFDGRLSLEMTSGVIGSSHFIDRKWVHTPMDRYTGSLSLSLFLSRLNLELKAGGARYVNEDYGMFASCLRHFNEISVGLYAIAGKSTYNGGFFFSVPFFFKRRPARKLFRITLPEQYGFSYNAGTEYFFGQSLVTNPNSIYRDRLKWNNSINNMITNFKNDSK